MFTNADVVEIVQALPCAWKIGQLKVVHFEALGFVHVHLRFKWWLRLASQTKYRAACDVYEALDVRRPAALWLVVVYDNHSSHVSDWDRQPSLRKVGA